MKLPNALLNQIATALLETPRPRPFPHRLWERILSEGWASMADLDDLIEGMDGRLFHIRLQELAEAADFPVRSVQRRPRFLRSDTIVLPMMAIADVVGFCIFLEQLGFAVDAKPMVDALHSEVASLPLQTTSQGEIYSYSAMRHKLNVVLKAGEKVEGNAKEQAWRSASGHRFQLFTRGDQAAMLTIIGPKWRKLRRVDVDCPVCGARYTKGDLESSMQHRRVHAEVTRLLSPRPTASMRKRLQANLPVDRVDAQAPLWMHSEVEQRAWRFKRDFGYDFLQWPKIRSKADFPPNWVGFLFVDNDGKIDGACAFHNPEGTEWSLHWVWIRPERRRHGLLAARWTAFLAEFGDFWIEHPLSREMAAFVAKHASTRQRQLINDRYPAGSAIEEPASVRRTAL